MSEERKTDRKSIKFYSKKTQNKILEIVDAFEIDKMRISFMEYDNKKEKGNKITQKVDYYLSFPDFELLCQNLGCGCIAKRLKAGEDVDPIYKGSSRNGQMYARIWRFSKADKGVFFEVAEGPGKKDEHKGIVKPLFKFNEAPNKVSICMSVDEMKMFAIQGKRACDCYYQNFFLKNMEEKAKADSSTSDNGNGKDDGWSETDEPW